MSKEFDLYLRFGKEKLRQLKSYRDIAKKVKEIVQKHLGKVDIYVFGSLVEGETTALSDIDVLVVVDSVSRDEAYKLKAKVHELVKAPVELHVASTWEFENWYKRFIGKLERVI
ncbi:MAG: nucleotidyltransferase domain-containing protein [Candidatus Bathyarchaeia archaeon]